jgi:hypothetical protein
LGANTETVFPNPFGVAIRTPRLVSSVRMQVRGAHPIHLLGCTGWSGQEANSAPTSPRGPMRQTLCRSTPFTISINTFDRYRALAPDSHLVW